MRREAQLYACDFETTVFKGQEFTEVWSSALTVVGNTNPKEVIVHHSIDETFSWCCKQPNDLVLYYHNLKFDGEFWVYYLLHKAGYKVAYVDEEAKKQKDISDLVAGEFITLISDMGQWYQLAIQTPFVKIVIRDSLKLMPFTLKEIGKAFKTKHQKLDMEYTGERYAGCPISADEMAYIKNDVLVLSEALDFMFNDGHKKLTIGSCCMAEFKKTVMKEWWDDYFPDLKKLPVEDVIELKAGNYDRYCRRSYRGAWCYVNPLKAGRTIYNGRTYDVNSLYPSMMHSDSGNRYPIGIPHFFWGSIPYNGYNNNNLYYIVTFRCMFHVKQNYLPFVQIKSNPFYKPTECLTTSEVDHPTVYDEYGTPLCNVVELTMCQPDFELFLEHYDVYHFEILYGVYFHTDIGLFDEYINKYRKIKMESKGAMRTEAKLFLNNLYGKFATGDDSSYKTPYYDSMADVIKYSTIEEHDKAVGYIPVGSAITAYARCFTIRAAQKNIEHFCYADTDSVHVDCPAKEVVGIPEHPTEFCHWKCESEWDMARFVRQKTYAEHIVISDGEQVEPYWEIKCAGMPKNCKNLLVQSIEQSEEDAERYRELMREEPSEKNKFLSAKRTIDDFKEGLLVPDKLIPRRMSGGIVLHETTFEMR